MQHSFFTQQNQHDIDMYVQLLEITGSLSNLFSESINPFIYYRAMENIFCKAFHAENLSRSDISADASKNGLGVGLKTFVQGNGNTFQKVAEFNKDLSTLKNLTDKEFIRKISGLRNERIKATMRICDLDAMIYHLLTRSEKYFGIYEEDMDFVDINNIKIIKNTDKTIHFVDGINEYNFNFSKSTLLKRFDTTDTKMLYGFNVNILKDPFDFLLASRSSINKSDLGFPQAYEETLIDYIILPLYSPRSRVVELKSGLNQWNASGRKRNQDEVYIPIPSWIHQKKKGFFDYKTPDYKTDPFEVKLPSGKVLSMKVAQQGGKALMSNPNSDLGKWILRDILQLKPGEIVTIDQLQTIGIDSVMLGKTNEDKYTLDFLKQGSFDDFEEKLNK